MGQGLNENRQIESGSNSQQADRSRHPVMLCMVEYLKGIVQGSAWAGNIMKAIKYLR